MRFARDSCARKGTYFGHIAGARTAFSPLGQIIDSHLMVYVFRGRYVPDLHYLTLVAGWEPYILYDRVSWVGSVPVEILHRIS